MIDNIVIVIAGCALIGVIYIICKELFHTRNLIKEVEEDTKNIEKEIEKTIGNIDEVNTKNKKHKR